MATEGQDEWQDFPEVATPQTGKRIEIQKKRRKSGKIVLSWRYRWQLKDGEGNPKMRGGKYLRGYEYGGKIETIPNDKRIQEYRERTRNNGSGLARNGT